MEQAFPRWGFTLATSALMMVSSASAATVEDEEPFEVNPSRPTYTNSPEVGPKGGFEVNIGYASRLDDLFVPLQFKYTVTNDWEVRLGYNVVESAYGGNSSLSGIGDMQPSVQWCPSAYQKTLHWGVWVLLNAPTGESLRMAKPQWFAQGGFALAAEWGRWRAEGNLYGNSSFGVGRSVGWELNSTLQISFSVNDDWTIFVEDYEHYEVVGGELESRLLGGIAFGVSDRVVLDLALEGPLRADARADEVVFHSGVSFILPLLERPKASPAPLAVLASR